MVSITLILFFTMIVQYSKSSCIIALNKSEIKVCIGCREGKFLFSRNIKPGMSGLQMVSCLFNPVCLFDNQTGTWKCGYGCHWNMQKETHQNGRKWELRKSMYNSIFYFKTIHFIVDIPAILIACKKYVIHTYGSINSFCVFFINFVINSNHSLAFTIPSFHLKT